MIYLLNTAILTDFGRYDFAGPLSPSVARSRLQGGFESAIGHDAAAEFLRRLLDLPVSVNRVAIHMQPGDAALVLRLKSRLPEGRMLTVAEMARADFELGWLQRID